MLRTESNGSAPVAALSLARLVAIVIGGPRKSAFRPVVLATLSIISPGHAPTSPALPFGFARQLDRRHLLELDRAVLDQVVERRVCRARDLHAIEVHGERRAMVGVGPGRGQADALRARRHPILFLIEALLDVRAGDAAVLGGPVHPLFQLTRGADGGEIMHRLIGSTRGV